MQFYDALQLDPSVLKGKIKSAETKEEARKLKIALAVRALLLVSFSVVFIAPLSSVFGSENSPMGVALLCIILSVRFVDFGYCVKDSLRNLGLTFLILLICPVISANVNPFISVFINFLSLFSIIAMTSDQPEMGNGGLYAFAYILLTANPVSGELFLKRAGLALLGYIICAAIFYGKHREKNEEIRFRHLADSFHLSNKKCQWQLQLSLGVSLLLLFGNIIHIERVMWAGFACASLLSCYSVASCEEQISEAKSKFVNRIIGVVIGSSLFALFFSIVPEEFQWVFGPLGGICLGFCTKYRYKTAMNCFGALLLATSIYGLHDSVILRIINNFIGAAFGYGFFVIYKKIIAGKFDKISSQNELVNKEN